MSKSYKIALTGGMGSGKSYACRRLKQKGYPVFFCDDVARHIIVEDQEVVQALKSLIGESVYAPDGTLCKSTMSAFIRSGNHQAAQVNEIVHPKVAQAFQCWANQQQAKCVLMECALLFESGFDALVDKVILITASEDTRKSRVMQRDGISREQVEKWFALQMCEEDKMKRADAVIKNEEDGNETWLNELEEALLSSPVSRG